MLLAILSSFIPMSTPHVEVKPEPLFYITETIPFTNSVLLTIILDGFLILLAVFVGRNLKLVPGAFQNVVEIAIDGLFKLFQGVNRQYVGKVFPVVATIFFFLLFSNWFGLIPGVGAIGLCRETNHQTEVYVQGTEMGIASTHPIPPVAPSLPAATGKEDHKADHAGPSGGCPKGKTFVPLFRSPSADLNLTFALAILAFFYIEYLGFSALGPGYVKKFFNTAGFKKGVAMGIMEFLVGLLELVSELARIIAFSFRLFGNIFAGEVLLLVMAFLVPIVLPIPFYGFEVFVGFIQAFVFAMLTMAFIAIAVTPHGDEHGAVHH